MKELLQALKTRYDSEDGLLLRGLTPGGLWQGQSPQDGNSSYIVWDLISDVPEYTFNTASERIVLSFTIYVSPEMTTPETIEEIYEVLIALFDFCELPMESFGLIEMRRIASGLRKDPKGWWQRNVDYRLLIQVAS